MLNQKIHLRSFQFTDELTVTSVRTRIQMQSVDPSPNGYIYKTTSTPKAERTLQKGGGKFVKAKGSESLLLVISEATPLRSHQYDCINMS